MAKKYFDEHGNEIVVEEKKRGGCLKWALIIIGVLILIGACSAMFGGDSSSTDSGASEDSASTTSEQSEDTDDEDAVGIGEETTAGDLSIRVSEVTNQETVGNEYLNSTAGSGNYLLANVEVKNNGNEAIMVDSNNFKLIDGEKTYEADGEATIYANEDDSSSFLLNNLNPDSATDGVVVFDIPAETSSSSTLQLVMTGGFLSGDEAVININQ